MEIKRNTERAKRKSLFESDRLLSVLRGFKISETSKIIMESVVFVCF